MNIKYYYLVILNLKLQKPSVYHLDYIKGIKMQVYDPTPSMVNKNQFKLDTEDKYNQCMLIPNTINKKYDAYQNN